MSQNRSAVSRFENFLQGFIEGSFGRIFRTRLQPVELSRKLERAMDENLTLSAGRHIAPNYYTVWISESDMERFRQFMHTLKTQMQNGLISAARQRGYTMTTNPFVAINSLAELGTGEVRIRAELLDRSQLSSALSANNSNTAVPSESNPAVPPDATTVFVPGPMPASAATPNQMPYAAMVLRTPQGPGQAYPINREVVHIGRHTTNDIVVNDQRVSRYHAEIRFERGQFILYDLGSLNGVSVNGALTRQATLRNGDIVAIGTYSFVFERR
jgi:Protein of unknown function (DUF3662)/FHA domain